jgi:hypothetical protein
MPPGMIFLAALQVKNYNFLGPILPNLHSSSFNTPSFLKPTHNNTFSFTSSSSFYEQADFEEDWKIKETFISVRRVPESKFLIYLDAFKKEMAATGETHNNRPELVKHFLNWSEFRYKKELKQTSATAGTSKQTNNGKFTFDLNKSLSEADEWLAQYNREMAAERAMRGQ